jgi:hypothetical protein
MNWLTGISPFFSGNAGVNSDEDEMVDGGFVLVHAATGTEDESAEEVAGDERAENLPQPVMIAAPQARTRREPSPLQVRETITRYTKIKKKAEYFFQSQKFILSKKTPPY